MSDYETLEIVGTARKETINKNKGQKARGKIFITHNIHMGLIQLMYRTLSSQWDKARSAGKLAKVINKQ